ncbi:zinc finger CCHC domain-containing protein 9 [Patella vulgata]|uniref:zinc finger CCHC domain-containing protein 9 n=1 Tax=Patella vulgata TaxID=6465 RepID=UPI0024A863DD|nr:zinc finger CCHC domain-containing protein 9 [Patella vulgata]
MTRFARAGAYQKKQPHDATSWLEMKSSGAAGSSSSSDGRHRDDHQKTASRDRFHRKRGYDDSFNNSQQLDEWKRGNRSEFRRQKRMDKREAVKVCFNCRKEGHMVAECPDEKRRQGMGICFKCGSTEHGVSECRAKVKSDEYPYATCFICKETGHLSKQCPDNPRGLYPNGGCCKECGSVEHFRRDCPELQKQQGFIDVKASKISDLSSADAEPTEKIDFPPPKIRRKGPKIVKF